MIAEEVACSAKDDQQSDGPNGPQQQRQLRITVFMHVVVVDNGAVSLEIIVHDVVSRSADNASFVQEDTDARKYGSEEGTA